MTWCVSYAKTQAQAQTNPGANSRRPSPNGRRDCKTEGGSEKYAARRAVQAKHERAGAAVRKQSDDWMVQAFSSPSASGARTPSENIRRARALAALAPRSRHLSPNPTEVWQACEPSEDRAASPHRRTGHGRRVVAARWV
jgi:hypothetical protein